MYAHLIRVLSVLALGISAAVMLYPERQVLSVDLSDLRVQAAVFALYLVLRVLALVGRLRNDPMLQYRSSIWALDESVLGRRVFRGVLELVLLTAAMELGQWLLPHRIGRVADFAVNASAALAAAVLTLIVLKVMLKTTPGRRLIQRLSTLDS